MPRKKKTVQEANIPEIKSELASKIDALETELEQVTSGTSTEKNQPEKKLTVTKSTKGKKKLTVTDEENKEIVSTEISAARKIFADEDDSVIEALEERIKQRKEEREKAEAEREAVEKEKAEKREKLTLAYLINETYKFVRKEISLEEFNNLGEQIDVLGYIPILSKMRIVMSFIYDIQHLDSEVHELNILEIQKKLFFEVLLKEYASIDISDDTLVNYSSYDLLYPLFYPYIIQYCGADYNSIVKMIDDSLNLYNLQELVELLNSADYSKIEEQAQTMRKLINTLNADKGLISDIKDIVVTTGQTSNNFNKVVTDVVLKEEGNN